MTFLTDLASAALPTAIGGGIGIYAGRQSKVTELAKLREEHAFAREQWARDDAGAVASLRGGTIREFLDACSLGRAGRTNESGTLLTDALTDVRLLDEDPLFDAGIALAALSHRGSETEEYEAAKSAFIQIALE